MLYLFPASTKTDVDLSEIKSALKLFCGLKTPNIFVEVVMSALPSCLLVHYLNPPTLPSPWYGSKSFCSPKIRTSWLNYFHRDNTGRVHMTQSNSKCLIWITCTYWTDFIFNRLKGRNGRSSLLSFTYSWKYTFCMEVCRLQLLTFLIQVPCWSNDLCIF